MSDLSEGADVVVVGAGALGAALAYRLSQGGCRVTVLEARPTVGSGTSSTSIAVDVTHSKTPRELFDLSLRAVDEHQALVDELGGTWRHPVGHLEWGITDERRRLVRERSERLRGWDYPVVAMSPAGALEVEPGLDPRALDGAAIVYFPRKAWYDAPAMIDGVLTHARGLGAEVRTGEEVGGIRVDDGRVVEIRTTAGTSLRPDLVVSCAGPETTTLLGHAGIELPLHRIPGLVVTARPPSPLVRGIVGAPEIALRPGRDGRVVMNSWEVDGRIGSEDQAALAEQLLAKAASLLPGMRDARVESHGVGIRPVPPDGMPLVGWVGDLQNLYVVASHSGIHLAPVLGRLAAREILTGHEEPQLAAFRPHRRAAPGADGPLDESARLMAQRMQTVTRPSPPGAGP